MLATRTLRTIFELEYIIQECNIPENDSDKKITFLFYFSSFSYDCFLF